MDEETRARRLAEWLSSPDGTDPPDEVDADVRAAVYALAPERAPAPRVALDDILGVVTEGPFARAASAAPAAGMARRARPAWVGPAFGVVVALAAVALFAIPRADRVRAPDPAEAEAARALEAAPRAEPGPDLGADGAADASGTVAEATDAVAPAPTAGAPAASAEAAPDGGAAPSEAEASGTAAPSAGGGAAPGKAADAPMEAAPTAPPASAWKDAAPTTIAELDAAPAMADEAPLAADARARSEEAEGAAPARGAAEKKSESTASGGAPRASKAAAPTSAAAPAAGIAASGAASRADAEGASSPSRSAGAPAGMAARGYPADYAPDWYRGRADTAGYAVPLAAEARGDRSAAATAWAALAAHPTADVAADAAFRGARALRAVGRTADALALVDTGLGRAATNTPFRSNLLALRAELLRALGRTPEADAALAEALRLNAARGVP